MRDCYLVYICYAFFSAKTEDGYSTGNEKIAIRWTMKNYSSVFYMLWADLPIRLWCDLICGKNFEFIQHFPIPAPNSAPKRVRERHKSAQQSV